MKANQKLNLQKLGLVVIAIIAILAAILFPVFAQARDKARAAACLSNTKQLSLGVLLYGQDYDEILPVIGYNQQCRGRWQWQIYPYVKNQSVFTCSNINQPWRPTVQNYTGVTNSGCPGVTIQAGTEKNKKPPCKQGGFLFASSFSNRRVNARQR